MIITTGKQIRSFLATIVLLYVRKIYDVASRTSVAAVYTTHNLAVLFVVVP